MVFEIRGKVALITGGAQGMGFEFAEALLKNGLKGVTIVDTKTSVGEAAAKKFNDTYGKGKAIFVTADVTDTKQLEDAFNQTIKTFNQIDILLNNAGIFNDSNWETTIKVNINGVVNGMLLGLDNFLKKYKSTSEAVILNTISICATDGFPAVPIYTLSKFAGMGIVKSWGCPEHFQRTGVRVLGICPGATDTDIINDLTEGVFLSPDYYKLLEMPTVMQKPEYVAQEVVKLLQKALNGSVWVIEDEATYEYLLPQRETFKIKA